MLVILPPLVVHKIMQSACLYDYLFVCPLTYLNKHTTKFHEIFRITCYLWPWLGPPRTTVQYVIYFRFVDDVMF